MIIIHQLRTKTKKLYFGFDLIIYDVSKQVNVKLNLCK